MKFSARRSFLLLSIALVPLFAEDALKYGQPACSGQVLDKKFFVICYDSDRLIPAWVGYALTKQDLGGPAKRKSLTFRVDPAVRGAQAIPADYSKSGYDKGHMAPAADFKRSTEALKTTFFLTNIVPQRHGVNAGQWGKLEDAVRSLADSRGDIWVFSGPVFAGGRPLNAIGPHHVAVPTHTFKVILCVRQDDSKEAFAFVMPNLNKPSGAFTDSEKSVNFVEKLTGMDFFDKLPGAEHDRLEATVNPLPAQ